MAAVNRRWLKELLTYVCYTLPFAFLPIGFLYVLRKFNGGTLTIPGMVTDGGILTIAITLGADALLRLLLSDSRWRELKIVLAALACWAMTFGSFFYALRSISRATTSVVFIDLCLLVLVVSLTVGAFCRFLPEDDR
jgi:hypothetical protein